MREDLALGPPGLELLEEMRKPSVLCARCRARLELELALHRAGMIELQVHGTISAAPSSAR